MTKSMSTNLQENVTLEEYFELDLASDEKLEYWNGNVWSMSGASPAHNLIVINTGAEIRTQVIDKGCLIFPSDMRIKSHHTFLIDTPI